jgi:hypothetical protein
MSYFLVAYFVFRCERCNRKESTAVKDPYKPRAKRPQDWDRIDDRHLCPGCAAIVKEALCPS